MNNDSDYILELGGQTQQQRPQATEMKSKPFICVQFECCSVYSRIYKNSDGSAYVGWCPKCAKKVQIKIGAGGVSSRFFTAK